MFGLVAFFIFVCLFVHTATYYLQTLRHVRFCALFRICVCVCLFVFLRRCLTSLSEGPRCIRQRQLLLSVPSYYKVYIHLAPAGRRSNIFATPDDARQNHRQWPSGYAVGIAYQDVWTVTICFQKTVLYFSFTGQCMHFLKCMISFPLNSSISFPPASSDQLWSPAHCPYSRGIGLHAKTQPNIFDLRVFRCICFFHGEQFGYMGICMEIRVAHVVIDSIMSKTVLHTF